MLRFASKHGWCNRLYGGRVISLVDDVMEVFKKIMGLLYDILGSEREMNLLIW